MSADWKLDAGRWDLTVRNGGLQSVAGSAEVAQRLRTRLQRQLGEWFLNTAVGLPWYDSEAGAPAMLGSKDRQTVELRIRQEALNTAGVLALVSFAAVWNNAARSLSIALQVQVSGAQVQDVHLVMGG